MLEEMLSEMLSEINDSAAEKISGGDGFKIIVKDKKTGERTVTDEIDYLKNVTLDNLKGKKIKIRNTGGLRADVSLFFDRVYRLEPNETQLVTKNSPFDELTFRGVATQDPNA